MRRDAPLVPIRSYRPVQVQYIRLANIKIFKTMTYITNNMYFISNIGGSSITQIEIALPEFKHGFEDMRLGRIVTNTVFAHRVD